MDVTIYGIKTCDTMRKARAWLDAAGVVHVFHDYRVRGVDRTMLEHFAALASWETLLNRAGTTFRTLPEDARQDLTESRAIDLMLAHPAAIKRPVLAIGQRLLVGFDPARYAAAFGR
jgi:arsenate reductase